MWSMSFTTRSHKLWRWADYCIVKQRQMLTYSFKEWRILQKQFQFFLILWYERGEKERERKRASIILSVLLTNQYLNFHLNFCQNYVHRSGRTARAMKEGLSVMLISPDDVKNYRKIVHTLNRGWFHPTSPMCVLITTHFQHLQKTWNKVFM